jgi:hypothetical protein
VIYSTLSRLRLDAAPEGASPGGVRGGTSCGPGTRLDPLLCPLSPDDAAVCLKRRSPDIKGSEIRMMWMYR